MVLWVWVQSAALCVWKACQNQLPNEVTANRVFFGQPQKEHVSLLLIELLFAEPFPEYDSRAAPIEVFCRKSTQVQAEKAWFLTLVSLELAWNLH